MKEDVNCHNTRASLRCFLNKTSVKILHLLIHTDDKANHYFSMSIYENLFFTGDPYLRHPTSSLINPKTYVVY